MSRDYITRTCRICGTSYNDRKLNKAHICNKCEDEILDWIKENRKKLIRIIFSDNMEEEE